MKGRNAAGSGETRRARTAVHSWRDEPSSRSPFWKPRQLQVWSAYVHTHTPHAHTYTTTQAPSSG